MDKNCKSLINLPILHIGDEVNAKIAQASLAFADYVKMSGIRIDTMLKVYKAVVLPTHFYRSET